MIWPEDSVYAHVAFRERFSRLSWYVKNIKQSFSRINNRKKKRRRTLWGVRFKSVIVEKGEAVISGLAYRVKKGSCARYR